MLNSGRSNLSGLLSVARGDRPANLVLKNARIVNVFSGAIEAGDVAIVPPLIVGIGSYRGAVEIELNSAYVAPGLIDAHVHIESSLCIPRHFASAVVPRGVTTVVTDPHEIANVAGVNGVRFMIDASQHLPLNVVTNFPSCVPATEMATTGARLNVGDRLTLQGIHGLAEVMNFPAVITGDAAMLDKLDAFAGRPIDGHCPAVRGAALNAYALAGIGSDHESVTVDEASEKLARGLYVLIREATNAHNLDALLPLITEKNSRRICFCTDDRQPADLLSDGGIDHMLRRAIAAGLDPITAFRCCTLNTAEWFRLDHVGAIAPGRFADLFIFDDLSRPQAREVYYHGKLYDPTQLLSDSSMSIPASLKESCHLTIATDGFRIAARTNRIRVIGCKPDQLITDHRVLNVTSQGGDAVADLSRDVLKMAVIERHQNTGHTGLGFIQGFGLHRGAIAGTVAHDHHNLVVIGCDDASMITAARAVDKIGGGLVVAVGEQVLATLPLPVAGLMSDRPIAEVRIAYDALLTACKTLGTLLHDPFMAMSFMALEVIPSLKLTDKGLVDVEQFKIVDLFV